MSATSTSSADDLDDADDEDMNDSDLPYKPDWEVIDEAVAVLRERSAEGARAVQRGLDELDDGRQTIKLRRRELWTKIRHGTPMATDEWFGRLDEALKLSARVKSACDAVQAVYDRHIDDWPCPGDEEVGYLAAHFDQHEWDFHRGCFEIENLMERLLYQPLMKRRAGEPPSALEKDLVVLKMRSAEDYGAVCSLGNELHWRSAKAAILTSTLQRRLEKPLMLSASEQQFYEHLLGKLASELELEPGWRAMTDIAAQHLYLPELEAVLQHRRAAWSAAIAEPKRLIAELSPFTLA